VAASLTAPEATFASDYEAAPFALLENLLGAEANGQLQHRTTVPPLPAPVADGWTLRGLTRMREMIPSSPTLASTAYVPGCTLTTTWSGSRQCMGSATARRPLTISKLATGVQLDSGMSLMDARV